MRLLEVDGSTFEREVVMSAAPVVVDFYADWCGPCRMLAPTLRALARSHTDDVRFVTVNIDRSPELARRFDVRSIPTIIRFDAGEVSGVVMGAQSAKRLTNELALSSGAALSGATPPAHRWWLRRRAARRPGDSQSW